MAEARISEMKPVSTEEMSFRETYEKKMKRALLLIPVSEKDLMLSVVEKQMGNECVKKREYRRALRHYNTGLRLCPQNGERALQMFCMLLGNRTTVNMELERFEKVLEDIMYLDEIGKYPISSKYKISWRRAKCYEARGEFETADHYYEETFKLLTENSDLTGEELQKKLKALKHCKENKTKLPTTASATSSSGKFLDVDEFEGSEKYPAASQLIDIKFDDRSGRHAVAKEDIPVGTLIVKEDPHVALIDGIRSLTHCQVCLVYAFECIIPCSTCINVVYCSNDCKKLADASFHKFECPIYPTLIGKLDKLLSLRILTQRGFKFFDDQKDKLLNQLESSYQGLTTKEVYLSDDYDNMIFLYRNVDQKSRDQIYVNKAVFLLRVLKKSGFFPFRTNDKVLRDEELFIGRLILRHCYLMTCNVNEINQLKYPDYYNLASASVEERTQRFESIGIGLFPTFALFNHACEPSIIRYNDKARMLVRTIKPIKAGEIIYDNYGPNYLFMKLQLRQQTLSTKFFFKCTCTPCVEKWPMASSLERVVMVPCKTVNCNFVFPVVTHHKKQLLCLLCHRELRFADIKEITEVIEHHCTDGDKMFQEKKFDDALKAYKNALDIKYAHIKRPDIDIIKIQERMEHIFAKNGNVANYK